MKPMSNAARLTRILPLTLGLTLLLCGCQTHARLDNSRRMMARPDAEQARQAAPEWVRDALKTINALESEIERR